MSYEDLRDYLQKLKEDTERKEIHIDWNVIDPSMVRAVNHDQLAGLQLADAVATSVYYAVTDNFYGDREDRYLRLLTNTIYRHEKRADGYGLKFWGGDKGLIAEILAAISNETL